MAKPIENRIDFLSPVSVIPGIGERRISAFCEAGIETVGDLLYHFPRRYTDRSKVVKIGDLDNWKERDCTVIGEVSHARLEPGRRKRFRIQITDQTGTMEALWFHGVQFYQKSIKSGMRLLLTGKVTCFGRYQMVHPLIETIGQGKEFPDLLYMPSYPLTGSLRESGVQQKMLSKLLLWALKNLKHYPQILPEVLERKYTFPPLPVCLKEVHFPSNLKELEKYKFRLRYEELYKLALTLRWNRRKFALPGRSMKPGDLPDRFRKELPFKLTGDQDKAIGVLYEDALSSQRMHRLLQGDVGTGKTLVAFFACFPALASGLQVAWCAPTEVLARQTYNNIKKWLITLGYDAALLMGSTKASDRQTVFRQLASGELRFIVGTHALFMQAVRYKNLGMIVIDEQHKFGAEQRSQLQEKDLASDFLLMSATPIPQTLAKTIYGDLDSVVIAKAPAGRIPISTHMVSSEKRLDMERFVLKEIEEQGAQVYYVVPRIELDDDEEIKDAQSTFEKLSRGIFAPVTSACIHGRMKADEKEMVMTDFVSGKTKLLVATTVIEVGVDVPDATIIVIENAEMFGLAQLHQLRGRVGRGSKKSWCFLLAGESADENAIKRLSLFCKYHDGFKIAEMDLKSRGPGQVVGFRQSGWDDLKMADILRDADLFRSIQEELEMIIPRS